MKKLLTTLVFFTFVSCASQPKIFKDEYGIIHRSHVSTGEIAQVEITTYEKIPVGCKRLRNIYISGTSGKRWQLKEEAAKMGATHVTHNYVNNYSDTMGIAFDCANYRATANSIARDKLYLQRKAMGELEKRRAAKGEGYKLTPVKQGAFNNSSDGIPYGSYNPNK